MNRKSFILGSSVALAAAAGIPAFYKWRQFSRWNNLPLIHPDILSRFCDEETIQEMGLSYKSITPAESSERQLRRLLLNSLEYKKSVSSNPVILTDLLDSEIQQDFYSGKIVNVRGWVISVTEGRQCALLTFA